MTDLQLMAHWIFVASSSFGFQPGDSLHWQRDVTQLACDFPFLMHGILAVSALSKSRSVPPSECQFWLWTAAHHQNKALPAYRQIIGEAEQYMNEQNCHAVMATGYLICVYAGFAVTSSGAYGTYGQGQCTIPELLEFFSLMRGARSIMSYKTQWAMNGPMAMYLRQWPSVIDVSLNPHDERIADLTAVFDRVESSPGEQIHSDADVYRTTLMLLREAFAVPFQPVDGVGWKLALMTWVERIPQRYLELLSDSKPEALLILGYFAVLPKRCALQDWYAEGAAERVLSMVCNSLGEQWSHWLAWPMEEIGANS
ncbi:MAG: hypothetical protein M1820_009433 [Bogoriella megaspora]|nr:MAG: hypothetical protein M1820_009433 [Bogoriella megaspora]